MTEHDMLRTKDTNTTMSKSCRNTAVEDDTRCANFTSHEVMQYHIISYVRTMYTAAVRACMVHVTQTQLAKLSYDDFLHLTAAAVFPKNERHTHGQSKQSKVIPHKTTFPRDKRSINITSTCSYCGTLHIFPYVFFRCNDRHIHT